MRLSIGGGQVNGVASFHQEMFQECGFKEMLWLGKGLGFSGEWTVNDQNDLLARLFGLEKVNKPRRGQCNSTQRVPPTGLRHVRLTQ